MNKFEGKMTRERRTTEGQEVTDTPGHAISIVLSMYETIGTTRRDFEIEDCKCCDVVGTVVQSKESRRKARRNQFSETFVRVGPEGNGSKQVGCNSNCNQQNCSGFVLGHDQPEHILAVGTAELLIAPLTDTDSIRSI